jgi:hypothetical protein
MKEPPMTDERFPDEILMAFADGELDAAEADRIAAAMAADPALERRIEAFRRSRALVREALGPLEAEPIPPALRAFVEGRTSAVDHPAESAEVIPLRRPTAMPFRQRVALPLAASLALVVGGVGGYLARDRGPGPSGALVLDTALEAALDATPSGQQRTLPDGTEVRLIASFVDGAGRLCREFGRTAADDALVVVACISDEVWAVRFAVAVPAADGVYVPASALGPLDAYLETIEAGPPLSIAEEAAALGLGQQP